jgi:hypothetical protein
MEERQCDAAEFDSEVAKRAVADLGRGKANVRRISLFVPGVSDRGDTPKPLRLPAQAMPHRGTAAAARRELALLSAMPRATCRTTAGI